MLAADPFERLTRSAVRVDRVGLQPRQVEEPEARRSDAGALEQALTIERCSRFNGSLPEDPGADQRETAHVPGLRARLVGAEQWARGVERCRKIGILGHADAWVSRTHRGECTP